MKITRPDLGNLDAEREPYTSSPAVSDDIQQTLARVIGFDLAANLFRFLSSDQYGRLTTTPNHKTVQGFSRALVGVTGLATVAIPANYNRVYFAVLVVGADKLWVKFRIGDTEDIAIILSPGGYYENYWYKGDVLAQSESGDTSAHFWEFK